MAVFFCVYRTIRRHYDEVVALWASVIAELEAFEGCMIYLNCAWWHPWLPGVYASDASESGYGVTYRLAPREAAADLGRVPERSRYA